LDPSEFPAARMALRGRIGGYTTHSRHDPREITASARAAFLRRFENEVDPQCTLPEAERERRAVAALKAWMARLAYRSAKVRSQRRQATPPTIGHDSPSGGA
jgi:hypothetical protein